MINTFSLLKREKEEISFSRNEFKSCAPVRGCDRSLEVRYEGDVYIFPSTDTTFFKDIVSLFCFELSLGSADAYGIFSEDGTYIDDHCVVSQLQSVKEGQLLFLRKKPIESFLTIVSVRVGEKETFWKGYLRCSMFVSEILLLLDDRSSIPQHAGVFDPVQKIWLSHTLRLDQQGFSRRTALCFLEVRLRPSVPSVVAILRTPLRCWTVSGSKETLSVVGDQSATAAQVLAAAREDVTELSLYSSKTGQPLDPNAAIDDGDGCILLVKGPNEDSQSIMEAAAAAFGHTSHFDLLEGETINHKIHNVLHFVPSVGKVVGILLLTPFRLLFVANDRSTYSGVTESRSSIPLKNIYKMAKLDAGGSSNSFLEITCRSFEAFVFAFAPQKHSRRLVMEHVERLQCQPPFALMNKTRKVNQEANWLMEQYYRIFGAEDKTLRLCHVNEDYSVCPTYPKVVVVPSSISDASVIKSSEFRSKGRFLATVWRHPDGPTITRSSQPMVGVGRKRCSEDEAIVAALGELQGNSVCLIDSRPLANAVANKLVGAGSESNAYYENCEIKYIGLGNIHVMRESWHRMRNLCQSRGGDTSYFQQGENWLLMLHQSEWIQNVQHILEGAVTMAKIVDKEKRSCITHCSDGWDRTSQLTSLVQIMLDPYYRTLEGFPRLIHKEWLCFGHRFETRAGSGTAPQEREISPIFFMFLDCVFQMTRQFHTAFEFSSEYLVTLLDASYSGQFGTFLFDSEKERLENGCDKCPSAWDYLETRWEDLRNPYYIAEPSQNISIYPSTHLAHLALWTRVFLRLDTHAEHEKEKAFLRLQQKTNKSE